MGLKENHRHDIPTDPGVPPGGLRTMSTTHFSGDLRMQVDRYVVSIQPKPARLIRAPLLGISSSSDEERPHDQESAASHFVEPYHTDPDQRSVIRRVLEELDISDEEGRRIFLLALEYEIGAFQQVILEHLDPLETTATDNEQMAHIATAAKQLSDLLIGAGDQTKANILKGMAHADIFNRIADNRYLASLECEIDRLACACETRIETERRRQEPSNQASRRFIKMLANIYSECFETKPRCESDEPFAVILRVVVEQTELPVRFDESFVRQTLSGTGLAG